MGETPARNSSGSATRQATQLQPAQQRRDAVVYGATRAIVMASLAEPDTPGWGAENTSIHQVGLKACWSYARPGQAGSLFNILPLRSIYISASCFRESVDETRGLSLSLPWPEPACVHRTTCGSVASGSSGSQFSSPAQRADLKGATAVRRNPLLVIS